MLESQDTGVNELPDEDHYRKLENMYHGHPLNQFIQDRARISHGKAEVIIPVRSELFHAGGAVHGAIYFKAMDDAAYFAVNSIVKDVFVLTSQFNTYFIRPINQGEIRAVGTLVSATKRVFIADAVAYNSEGKQIGRGSGIYLKSPHSLSEKVGYRL